MSTYNYSRYTNGRDFVFSAIDHDQAYLTGQGDNLKVGDFLILKIMDQPCRYEVRQIDYYSDPSDMWIALIHINNLVIEQSVFRELKPLFSADQGLWTYVSELITYCVRNRSWLCQRIANKLL